MAIGACQWSGVAIVRNARGAPVRLQRRQMSVPAPVQPDHRKVEPVVGAHDSPITLRRISDRHSRCTYCQCIQKLTSCNHFLSFSRMVVEALTPPRHLYRLISFGKNQQASIFMGSPRWAQYTSAKTINCTRGPSHTRLGQSFRCPL